LNGIGRQQDSAPQEIDVGDPQCDDLSPTQPTKRQHQHQQPVRGSLVSQRMHLGSRQIDVASLHVSRKIVDADGRIGGKTPGLNGIGENARQD